MAEMRRIIDQGLRNDLESKGYMCPQCRKTFQALEADRIMNLALGTFNCDVCGAELQDNENAENVLGSQDRMQRFNRQMRFILEGLRRTEGMVLPAYVLLKLSAPIHLSPPCQVSMLPSGSATIWKPSDRRLRLAKVGSKSPVHLAMESRETPLGSSCLWTRMRRRPGPSATRRRRRNASRTHSPSGI